MLLLLAVALIVFIRRRRSQPDNDNDVNIKQEFASARDSGVSFILFLILGLFIELQSIGSKIEKYHLYFVVISNNSYFCFNYSFQ